MCAQKMPQSQTTFQRTAPGEKNNNIITLTATRKATSPLFLSEMIAKLERTLSTA